MKREHILQSEKIAFYLKPYIYIYTIYGTYMYYTHPPFYRPLFSGNLFFFTPAELYRGHSSWKAAWSRGKN